MYVLLETAVNEQITSNGISLSQKPKNDNNGKNNSDDLITSNQKKLIEKLVKEQQIYGKERIRLLNIKSKEQAKEEIKKLLSNNTGGNRK